MATRKAPPGKPPRRQARGGEEPSAKRLKRYRDKRDFSRTSEPAGDRVGNRRPGLLYAIQRHDASRLHYDLRLEEGGVLKSWAIPKSPPEAPGEKRLAVETEDHPLDYASFEGRIPEGEYGAGTVALWDTGTYEPLEAAPGKRIVAIRGRRLEGVYALIKLKARKGEKDANWLFFKTGPARSDKGKDSRP